MNLSRFIFITSAGLLLAGCASTTPAARPVTDEVIPDGWTTVASTPTYNALSYDAGGVLLYTARPKETAGVRVVPAGAGVKLVSGEKDLTPELPAIESFDVSTERREVIFSAKRAGNFDIGLVSLDGSDIHWLPSDPSDEIAVQWAPRGNKVSYIVRSRGGDLVRTVHIPTSMQLTTDFPFGRVHALAWDVRAERYAVSWSSVDASDRIEVMTYAGDERKVTVAPSAVVKAEIEPAGGALLLRPTALRYNEKVPLVVWRAADRNEWNDARGAMQREVTVACAVIDHDPDEAFWTAVSAIPWIDSGRIYVIGASPDASAAAKVPSGVWITGDASLPAGHYRTTGRIVTVPPALVQSLGAAWVAHQLKGNPPANGSHR